MYNAEEGDGDCALWCSVIKLAMSDAMSADKSLVEDRQEARAWFERDGEDFREVCTLAGLEPDRLRTEALKQIAEHDRRQALRGPRPANMQPNRQLKQQGQAQKHSFNGEDLTVRQWSERTGIDMTVLYSRLNNGWSVERAVTTPTGASPKKHQSPLTAAA